MKFNVPDSFCSPIDTFFKTNKNFKKLQGFTNDGFYVVE